MPSALPTPFEMKPRAKASAICPAPMKPIRLAMLMILTDTAATVMANDNFVVLAGQLQVGGRANVQLCCS